FRLVRSADLGALAHAFRSSHSPRRDRERGAWAGARRSRASAGACMNELLRLLAYARRYLAQLIGAVVLMTGAGAATGMMALLVGPILYKALDIHSPDEP